ncbi:MAG: ribose 5-phosphate isomerase B [Ruminococcaceae bacterium]|nr:ribose 5-phosphate isomerase B [Oscillospiraceae bacterium]
MIAIGSDHGGYELKQAIKKHLDERKIEYKDYGTYSTDSCNYADFGEAVANAVAGGECEKGILVCGTGIGISIAANKVNGIRAACCSDTFSARMTRLHNDANIISMGGRVVGPGLACDMVDLFLDTEFEGGRHAERIACFTKIENKQK